MISNCKIYTYCILLFVLGKKSNTIFGEDISSVLDEFMEDSASDRGYGDNNSGKNTSEYVYTNLLSAEI